VATSSKVERAIDALAQRQPSHADVGTGCMNVLEHALRFDMISWFSLDPATLLPTRFQIRFLHPMLKEMDDGLALGFGRGRTAYELTLLERRMRFELNINDSLSPGALLQTPGHTATLHGVTNGRPDRSERYHAFPLPGAIDDELRLLCVNAGEAWGMIWLGRVDGQFTRSEQAMLAPVATRLGAIIRLSLLREAVRVGADLEEPPGLILMSDDVHVASVSPEAERLLGPYDPDAPWHWVSVLRAMRGGSTRATMVVEGIEGPATVHATTFGEQDAIIVERVRPYRMADRLVRAYGLSPRERDVADGVARGWSTRRIAFELDLADYTVQDHLQSVFGKVGVRSRKEVMAKLFFDRYMPEHRAARIPSPYGWYLT
jgi:DNA-binding CsgD family transcriptional regulator